MLQTFFMSPGKYLQKINNTGSSYSSKTISSVNLTSNLLKNAAKINHNIPSRNRKRIEMIKINPIVKKMKNIENSQNIKILPDVQSTIISNVTNNSRKIIFRKKMEKINTTVEKIPDIKISSNVTNNYPKIRVRKELSKINLTVRNIEKNSSNLRQISNYNNHSNENQFVINNKQISLENLEKTVQIKSNDVKPISCELLEAMREFKKLSRNKTNETMMKMKKKEIKELNVNKEKFICKECGKNFNSSNVLKDHYILMHTKSFHYSCYKCGKKYANSIEIAEHMQSCRFK